MLRKYANKWIAIRGQKVVAVGNTCEELDNQLKRFGVHGVLVSYEYSGYMIPTPFIV